VPERLVDPPGTASYYASHFGGVRNRRPALHECGASLRESATGAVLIFVDSHVHFRGRFDFNQFFDLALANISNAAREAGCASFTGVLILTETRGDRPFLRLAELAHSSGATVAGGEPYAWSFRRTQESCSLLASRGGTTLALIAARQIRTEEGLEVHLLGTEQPFPDGKPIAEVLAAGEARNLEQVIPWAPGKWLGRVSTLARLMTARTPRSLHLGDIGTRPSWWPTPKPFLLAQECGHHVLRGSDPGPFRGEIGRVGTFGFTIDARLDLDRPAAGLGTLLRDPGVRLEPFGTPGSTLWFARTEIQMALSKRERTRALPGAR
jgi:hypothetical protein